jgi:hypothetical protein
MRELIEDVWLELAHKLDKLPLENAAPVRRALDFFLDLIVTDSSLARSGIFCWLTVVCPNQKGTSAQTACLFGQEEIKTHENATLVAVRIEPEIR